MSSRWRTEVNCSMCVVLKCDLSSLLWPSCAKHWDCCCSAINNLENLSVMFHAFGFTHETLYEKYVSIYQIATEQAQNVTWWVFQSAWCGWIKLHENIRAAGSHFGMCSLSKLWIVCYILVHRYFGECESHWPECCVLCWYFGWASEYDVKCCCCNPHGNQWASTLIVSVENRRVKR